MALVLVREYGRSHRYTPINTQRRVHYRYTPVRLRTVVVVTLILEYGNFTQYRESVGEATRNEELPVVLLRQQARHVLSIGWRTPADIDRYVKDSTAHATH